MPHEAVEVQEQQVDTGIACTVILARVFGLPADPQQLKHEFGQSGKPFTNREIIRSARLLGLKAKKATSSWKRLSKLTLPAIGKHQDGHYFIIGKYDQDQEKVLVQDPLEKRPLVLPRDLFEQSWTGEVILFTRRAGIMDELRKFDFSWFIAFTINASKNSIQSCFWKVALSANSF